MSAGYQCSSSDGGGAAAAGALPLERSRTRRTLAWIEAAIELLAQSLLRGQVAQQEMDVRKLEQDGGLAAAGGPGFPVELPCFSKVPPGEGGVAGPFEPARRRHTGPRPSPGPLRCAVPCH